MARLAHAAVGSVILAVRRPGGVLGEHAARVMQGPKNQGPGPAEPAVPSMLAMRRNTPYPQPVCGAHHGDTLRAIARVADPVLRHVRPEEPASQISDFRARRFIQLVTRRVPGRADHPLSPPAVGHPRVGGEDLRNGMVGRAA